MINVRIFKMVMVGIFGSLVFIIYRANAVGSGWASLTAAMAHHQDDPRPLAPVVVKNVPWSSYTLLGWPSQNHEAKYDWIILDSTPGGDILKMPPDGNFVVTCAYLADLTTKVNIDPAVHGFLAAQCSKS